MILYVLAAILFGLGVWGVLAKRNLLKIVIALCILEYALFLLFALVGYRRRAGAPIETPEGGAAPFVDPLPQALVLTAIVIGLGVTALLVATVVRIHHRHGTLDVRRVRRLKG